MYESKGIHQAMIIPSNMKVLRGLENVLDTVDRLIDALVRRSNYKAYSNAIWQSFNFKKIDETERTKLIVNRLKREATVFQLIKYSNHLVSIFPILQTMNYIEA